MSQRRRRCPGCKLYRKMGRTRNKCRACRKWDALLKSAGLPVDTTAGPGK